MAATTSLVVHTVLVGYYDCYNVDHYPYTLTAYISQCCRRKEQKFPHCVYRSSCKFEGFYLPRKFCYFQMLMLMMILTLFSTGQCSDFAILLLVMIIYN